MKHGSSSGAAWRGGQSNMLRWSSGFRVRAGRKGHARASRRPRRELALPDVRQSNANRARCKLDETLCAFGTCQAACAMLMYEGEAACQWVLRHGIKGVGKVH